MQFAQSLVFVMMMATPLIASVRLQVIQGRPVVSEVFVNGHGPFRFLIDTGAQVNQMDAGLLTSVGLRPQFQVELVTAAGSTKVPGCGGVVVELNSAKAEEQEFLFTDLRAVRKLSPDIQGVLGEAFLSRFDYLLDLKNRYLAFGTQERRGVRTPMKALDDRPAIFTGWGWLVLDSGSDHLILFGNGAKPASGSIHGGNKLRNASVVRIPRQNGLAEDGLLPASLFHSVYVCNSARYLVLE